MMTRNSFSDAIGSAALTVDLPHGFCAIDSVIEARGEEGNEEIVSGKKEEIWV